MKGVYSFFDPQNKWRIIAIIAVVKIVLFTFFALELKHNWDPELMQGKWAAATGDTRTYFNPSDNFVNNGVYDSSCRMPGVLPLYAPIAWMVGTEAAKDGITLLQLAVSILSVYVLGLIAFQWTKNRWVFILTIVIYTASSFVSIWDNYLMADSFSTSFFIFSTYLLWNGIHQRKLTSVFWSGVFLIWAVFFRQIFLIVYPMVAIIMWIELRKSFVHFIKSGFTFILPCIFGIALWMGYQNKYMENTFVLTNPVENCYSTYTPEYQALAKFLIHMGYGEPFWDKETVTKWMLNYKENDKVPSIPDRHFNSAMNLDTLAQLRMEYHAFRNEKDESQKKWRSDQLLTKIEHLDKVYTSENKLSFYVLNRLRLFRLFVLPMKIDNLPLPSLANMNAIEKAAKLFYLVLFSLVSLVGLFSIIQTMMSPKYTYRIWWLIPLSILLSLSVVLGYIEQRYYVPIYPFMVIALAIFVARFFKKEVVNT